MHTQAYAQVDESLETGWRGALEQWMHCVTKKTPNEPHIQCASVFWDELSPERNCHFRRPDYMALQLQSHNWKKKEEKKGEKRYRKLSLRLSLPSLRLSFLSHHFQQWLQSVLLHIYHVVHLKMAARCGWGGESDAVTEIQSSSEDFCATQYS